MQRNSNNNQITIFLTAVMFFTRLPVPKNIDHSTELLQKSARYFSWVGLLVGSLGALVYWLLAFYLSTNLCIFSSILTTILITGAFHEDGFADVCDAFGGGWTKEKILLIMKDSRLGTYGVTGLLLMLGGKFLLLSELTVQVSTNTICLLIITAHSVSRLFAVSIMQQYNYVADIDASKSKPLANRKLYYYEIIIAIIGAFLPFLWLDTLFLWAIMPAILIRMYLGYYFYKWIGGYTGDCLGATQQVTEVILYLSFLLLWKFI